MPVDDLANVHLLREVLPRVADGNVHADRLHHVLQAAADGAVHLVSSLVKGRKLEPAGAEDATKIKSANYFYRLNL